MTNVVKLASCITSVSGPPDLEGGKSFTLTFAGVEGPFDYDVISGQVVNSERANPLLHRAYRPGWTLS